MDYSILMSVYHKENPAYFKEAIESMLNQTVKSNDFIIVCDGPLTKELYEVLDEYSDNIKTIRLEKNVGLGNALNKGIKFCKNELIARMDSDDISIPTRIETQLDIMRKENVDIVGSMISEFDTCIHNIVGMRKVPKTNDEILEFSKKRNPFNHPSVLFKKSTVENAGGYKENFPLFEDYFLWIRMLMSGAKGYNVQKSLLYMRVDKNLYQRRGGKKYAKCMLSFHKWLLKMKWIGVNDFILGAIPHYIVCVLPNFLRGVLYKKIHSK